MAQDFGYRDGSGALQVVKRLEQSVREDKTFAQEWDRLRKGMQN